MFFRKSLPALVLSACAGVGASAQTTLTLEWTFDGVPGTSLVLAPGESVVIGLRGLWSDPSGEATALGGVNNLSISITGDTGTDPGDSVGGAARVAPFSFGPAQNDGSVVSGASSFQINGINPAQNQFAAFGDTGNPSGIIWEFMFTAGGTGGGRTIDLSIATIDNALLFTEPFAAALNVDRDNITTPTAQMLIPAPGWAMLGLVAAGAHLPRRRRG